MSKKDKYKKNLRDELDSYINENFKLRLEKSTLETVNDNLREEYFKMEKERDKVRHLFKLHTIVSVLQYKMLELCNGLDIGATIKKNIINYQTYMVKDALEIPGSLTPKMQDDNNVFDNGDEAVNGH